MSLSQLQSTICQWLEPLIPRSKRLRPIAGWEKYYGHANHFWEKIRSRAYYALKFPKVLKWHQGLYIKIYPDNDLGRALFVSGTYEPNSLLVIKRFLNEGGTFIDVGANGGVFTLMASRWVGDAGRVISFEPSSREFRWLEENVHLNKLTNVRLEKYAVSGENGVAKLHIAIAKHNGQNTLCNEFAYENVDSNEIETVTTITLDSYIQKMGLDRVDLVKMDIEGAELAAFHGSREMFKKFKPVLIFEMVRSALNNNKIQMHDIEAFLMSVNYKTYAIDEQTVNLLPRRLEEIKDGNVVARFVEG